MLGYGLIKGPKFGLGKAIATTVSLVEEHNPELKGVLPRGHNLLPNATMVQSLRLLTPLDLAGSA